eukprot:TRINITY_DN2067_c0_g2_i1.p1 TRINITY_DN2067_c0_g2~~TRINITY_DN2067_c0_g2_i1.p1  ORF type:complete len:171 (+),score=20.82 TRINITY_DN2067_c0_g2_i1:114-626(+)
MCIRDRYSMELNEGAPLTTLHSNIALILLEYPRASARIDELSPYASKYMPAIPLVQYLQRISACTLLNDETLICALIYIDRLIESNRLAITPHETHRLLLIASVVSMKFHYDNYYGNHYYSAVGGISLAEFNALELHFLQAIGYRLSVTTRLFNRYKRAISLYRRRCRPV